MFRNVEHLQLQIKNLAGSDKINTPYDQTNLSIKNKDENLTLSPSFIV